MSTDPGRRQGTIPCGCRTSFSRILVWCWPSKMTRQAGIRGRVCGESRTSRSTGSEVSHGAGSVLPERHTRGGSARRGSRTRPEGSAPSTEPDRSVPSRGHSRRCRSCPRPKPHRSNRGIACRRTPYGYHGRRPHYGMTASSCSMLSKVEKSRSGKQLAGKTILPCLFSSKDCTADHPSMRRCELEVTLGGGRADRTRITCPARRSPPKPVQ